MNEDNGLDNSIARAHLKDQLDAAAEQAMDTAKKATQYMIDHAGRTTTSGEMSVGELLESYLMEDWDWFRAITDPELEPFEPEHCEHVDPEHPAMWYGLLNFPDKFWCKPCVEQAVAEYGEIDKYKCDRCSTEDIHQFFDIGFPIGNILMIGSVCKDCVDKTTSSI